jgi:hypothetical protein
MKDIYFITTANLGIHKKEFHIAMFENPKFPYFLPKIRDVLRVHLDTCLIIETLQKTLSNSEGCSSIYFTVIVSLATANKIIDLFPSDKIINSLTKFKVKKTEHILHDKCILDTVSGNKHGWKITSLAPCDTLQSLLSPHATWVGFFLFMM